MLVKNKQYWGKSKFSNAINKLIIRPISNNEARFQALKTGEINAFDLAPPQDLGGLSGDSRLKVIKRPAFNVAYVTIHQGAGSPMNDIKVRQAVAYGLNRAAVVRQFYYGTGTVAHEFQPPSLFGYSTKVTKYAYNPTKARQLLNSSNCKVPCKVDFWYPTDVTRPYMPDPKRNFEAFQASLEKSGFKVTPKSAPWDPDYLGLNNEGKQPIYLIGWTGDYGDPDNFIGTFFQTDNAQFGLDKSKELDQVQELLDQAEIETDEAKRTELYQEANRQIMELLPGVPYAHNKPAVAFKANVKGYVPSPVDNQYFATVSIEK